MAVFESSGLVVGVNVDIERTDGTYSIDIAVLGW